MAEPLRVGIVGCAEGTHGKVWAELLAGPGGERFGMRPVRVWDADPRAAADLAGRIGAVAVLEPAAVGKGVDGVLVTELFPDRYLELARPFLVAGQRVFLNRPFAGSMADAREIVRLAGQHGARLYSASALFHTAAGRAAREQLGALGPISLFTVTGPTNHLVFYLPHAIAALVSVLGGGVEMVQAVRLERDRAQPHLAAGPVVIYAEYGPQAAASPARGTIQMVGPGVDWYGFRLQLFGAKAEAEPVRFEVSYDLLLETMAEFFRTGTEPIPPALILEMTGIYYAALASAAQRGKPMRLAQL
jgi:predicted dehydrogenase